MKQIILKDLYHQRYVLIGGILALLASLLIPKTARIDFLIAPHILILLLTMILGIILMETTEEKDYGYTFLYTLPISRQGILGAKFGFLLGECTFFIAISAGILSIKGISDGILMGLSSLVALSFALNLTVGGIMLWGIYVFGVKNFTRAMMVAMILAQVFIFLFSIESFSGKRNANQALIILSKVLDTPPVLMAAIALVIWTGLLYLTSLFRKRI